MIIIYFRKVNKFTKIFIKILSYKVYINIIDYLYSEELYFN